LKGEFRYVIRQIKCIKAMSWWTGTGFVFGSRPDLKRKQYKDLLSRWEYSPREVWRNLWAGTLGEMLSSDEPPSLGLGIKPPKMVYPSTGRGDGGGDGGYQYVPPIGVSGAMNYAIGMMEPCWDEPREVGSTALLRDVDNRYLFDED
jgi:hypothetical protein